jgi:DNA invertase Pin-like site-specific DNA recombinase
LSAKGVPFVAIGATNTEINVVFTVDSRCDYCGKAYRDSNSEVMESNVEVMTQIETIKANGNTVIATQSAALAAISTADASIAASSVDASGAMRCVAYTRQSSLSNVGADRDGAVRQKLAVESYAKRAGFQIAEWFADPGVSGRDAVDSRPGFAAMLAYCAERGVKTIVLESASRFSRDLLVQEAGYAMLRKQGFTLIAADDPDAFTSDTPTAVMVRQILGAVSEFEKNGLVAKLKGARDRRSAIAGKRIEGRKGYDLTAPELVAAAKALRATGLSQRAISAALAARGFVTATGKTLSAGQVGRLLQYA